VYWLFVTGIALDIAVGVLVLGGIIFERGERRASRGMLILGGDEPSLEAMREPAFVLAGAALLASGFALQLAGYTIASGHSYFACFGVGVILVAAGVGYLATTRLIAPALHRQALKKWAAMQAERERERRT
jgi:hypothetical protein